MLGGVRMALALPGYAGLAIGALLSGWVVSDAALSPHTRRCLVSSAAFFGYVLGRTVLSPVASIARVDLCMVLAALIIYLLFTLHFTSARQRIAFVAVLLVLATASVAIGANQYLKEQNFMPFDFLPRVDYGKRASGFYSCPNHLAGFLEVIFFLSLSLALWSEWRVGWKILAGYAAIVCIAGILISGSRGGYLSTFAGLAVFSMVSFNLLGKRFLLHPWILRTVVVLIVLAMAFAAYTIVLKSELVAYRVETASSDTSVRVHMSWAALRQFLVNPLFGTGSATYLYYGRLFREPRMQLETTWAHNDVFQFLAEFGILGAIGCLAFLGLHLRSGWHAVSGAVSGVSATWLSGSHSLALSLAALCSVAAYTVHSFVDFNLHIPANALLMAFIFALLANPGDSTSLELASHRDSPPRLPRTVRFLLPLLGVWLIATGIRRLPAEYLGERARAILTDGESLLSEPQLQRAAEYASRALQWDSANPRLHYYAGEARVGLAELAADPATRKRLCLDAIAAYRKALEITPQDAFLHALIGGAFDSLGRFDEAEPHIQRALELDPHYGQIRWFHASHLLSQGRLEAAEAEFKKLYEYGMPWPALTGIQKVAKEREARATATAPAPNPP